MLSSKALPSLLILAIAAFIAGGAVAKSPTAVSATANIATVSASALPQEARDTLALIQAGGPFPYRKDGVTFFNREHQLPAQPRGYYREYTVKTQGASNRGIRRLVCGGLPVTDIQNCYYTDDHYSSFKKIQP
ncbi:MAG: ribonuclease [Betaproteobacteria bacterium]|nr:ribonuclease [Betaproteobacteria bacterium]